MQTAKVKAAKYIFQSPLLLFYLVLYSIWPIVFLAVWPADIIRSCDKSFVYTLIFWLYSLPAFTASLVLIGIDYLKSTCTAVYTFLTMNLLILSVIISVVFK